MDIHAQARLSSVSEVINKHREDVQNKRYGVVAVALARETLFGRQAIAKCTVGGRGNLRPLRMDEIETSSSLCSPTDEFEKVWAQCRIALNHAPVNIYTIIPRISSLTLYTRVHYTIEMII